VTTHTVRHLPEPKSHVLNHTEGLHPPEHPVEAPVVRGAIKETPVVNRL